MWISINLAKKICSALLPHTTSTEWMYIRPQKSGDTVQTCNFLHSTHTHTHINLAQEIYKFNPGI